MEVMMFGILEALAIGFSIALIFSVIFGFIAFVRYLNYKEKMALREDGPARQKEASYE
jgi:hypothetical protein